MSNKSGRRGERSGGLALYKRLPHGPHKLGRDVVIRNQRARIHGAMIEAVARNGYRQTNVKEIVALAGISRRSFYEQFTNRQDCFLITTDLILARELQQIRQAYLAAGGAWEKRARAAFKKCAKAVGSDQDRVILVLLEAQTAGPDGVLRLHRGLEACERMLARSFAEAPGMRPLPMPIVRGIVGGIYGTASAFLRHGCAPRRLDLAEEMLRWTLLFQTPSAKRMSERLARMITRIRDVLSPNHTLNGRTLNAHGLSDRVRLMQAMLRLAAREDYHELSAASISIEANLPFDTVSGFFRSKDECFVAALDMISDELLAIAADPDLVGDDWAHSVRQVLLRLMDYLAYRPLYASILVQEAFFAGADPVERIAELSLGIATLLTEGAPADPPGRLTTEAVAGAIWHTIRCQVLTGRTQLLGALSDHLAYIVLAPFIGADAAAKIVTEEPRETAIDRTVSSRPRRG